MAQIYINGVRKNLPLIRLDGKDYIILSGSYQRLRNEKLITDRYTKDGEIDRQKKNTGKHRWKMTLVIPASSSYLTLRNLQPGESFDFGDMSTILASDDKVYPQDGLEFYDVSANGMFGGSYTHYVYMNMDWESPYGDDPGIFSVPLELWGRDA